MNILKMHLKSCQQKKVQKTLPPPPPTLQRWQSYFCKNGKLPFKILSELCYSLKPKTMGGGGGITAAGPEGAKN